MSISGRERNARKKRDVALTENLRKLADLKETADKLDSTAEDWRLYYDLRDLVLQTLIEDACESGKLTDILQILTNESGYYKY